jgi:hypothetical protein
LSDKDNRSELLRQSSMNASIIESRMEIKGLSPKGFGLCDNCESFLCVENELGEALVECDYFGKASNRVISKDKPVTKCSKFWDKRNTKIRDLEAIAWLIDSKPNEPVGFIKPNYKRRSWGDYD